MFVTITYDIETPYGTLDAVPLEFCHDGDEGDYATLQPVRIGNLTLTRDMLAQLMTFDYVRPGLKYTDDNGRPVATLPQTIFRDGAKIIRQWEGDPEIPAILRERYAEDTWRARES